MSYISLYYCVVLNAKLVLLRLVTTFLQEEPCINMVLKMCAKGFILVNSLKVLNY